MSNSYPQALENIDVFMMPEDAQVMLGARFKDVFPEIKARNVDGSYRDIDLETGRMAANLEMHGSLPDSMRAKRITMLSDGSAAAVTLESRRLPHQQPTAGYPIVRLSRTVRTSPITYDMEDVGIYTAFQPEFGIRPRPLTLPETVGLCAVFMAAKPNPKPPYLGMRMRSPSEHHWD